MNVYKKKPKQVNGIALTVGDVYATKVSEEVNY